MFFMHPLTHVAGYTVSLNFSAYYLRFHVVSCSGFVAISTTTGYSALKITLKKLAKSEILGNRRADASAPSYSFCSGSNLLGLLYN